MEFVYDIEAKQEYLNIQDENYHYLFKVRRLKVGDIVGFRNLKDKNLYRYTIVEIKKKEANLKLLDLEEQVILASEFHLLWCIINPKVIYATLPMLNQLGVSKISFVYCDRSQKNFKLDLQKIQKILINSCQQSGRIDLMSIEIVDSLDEIIKRYKNFSVLNFGGEKELGEVRSVLVGCEGGFSKDELNILHQHHKIGLKSQNILKSETAVVAIASKMLI
jgi:16S rRNA (uracil1498-N3)-methyltransferase